jgi:hypothetical protein
MARPEATAAGPARALSSSSALGNFELVERDIPEPGPGQVRVKVEASTGASFQTGLGHLKTRTGDNHENPSSE